MALYESASNKSHTSLVVELGCKGIAGDDKADTGLAAYIPRPGYWVQGPEGRRTVMQLENRRIGVEEEEEKVKEGSRTNGYHVPGQICSIANIVDLRSGPAIDNAQQRRNTEII